MTEDRRRTITTTAAAELAGVTRTGLFTLAGRAKLAGVELRADRSRWPDGRTPLWDRVALENYLAGRPGRGANLRRTPTPEPEHPETDEVLRGER